MVNARMWMDVNYPRRNRKNVKKLDVSRKNLENCLDLTDFINLEELYCQENKLTDLIISDSCLLSTIDVGENRLEKINFLDKIKKPEILKRLIISNNNFSPNCLDIFAHFVNLEHLSIGNWNFKATEGKGYNRFTGSLEPLKSLTKLKSFYIEETDIDNGLEHLSDTVETILCSCEREGAKVKSIDNELSPFRNSLKSWKMVQNLNQEKQELQQDIFSLQEKVRLDNKEVERISKRNKELEEENRTLYEKLEKLQLEGAKIDEKVRIKKNELEKTKSKLEAKLESEFQVSFLENLLVSQEQIIRLEGSGSQQIINLSQKQLDKAKEKLSEKLSKEEISKICQVQNELIRLEIELEKEKNLEANVKVPLKK